MDTLVTKSNRRHSRTEWQSLLVVPAFLAVAALAVDARAITAAQTADAQGTSGAQRSGMLQAADATFVKNAGQGGQAEVALAKIAQEKASNAKVKAYAQMLQTDHEKANTELMSLAEQKSVTVPSGMSAKQNSTKSQLEKLSGAAFDRAYINDMVMDHRTDIADFEKAASRSDPDVKAFAAKTLPTLREHLKQAEEIQKEIGK